MIYNSHTCPGDETGDESGSESGSSSGEGEENPPYGGGGGGSSQSSGLPTMDFCEGMTQVQKNIITSTFTNVRNMNCATNAMVLQLKQVSSLVLGMCINASATQNGNYVPNTKSIVFPTDFAAGHQEVFRHEVFHAYQDNVAYPGGTANYGSGDPGFVNIEFEQAVFKDIMNGYASALDASSNTLIKNLYSNWIISLTQGGTVYPNITTISDFETKYFEYLNEFNTSNTAYGGGTILSNLKPEALKAIFSGLTKDNCGM